MEQKIRAAIGIAEQYTKDRKFQEAKDALQAALENSEDSLPLKGMLCKVHIFLDEYDEAVSLANSMLVKDIENAEAYFYKGMAASFTQQYEDAKLQFNLALEYGFDSVVIWKNMAKVCAEQGDIARAVVYYDKIIETDHKNIAYRIKKAQMLIASGYFEAALSTIEELIFVAPEMERAYEFQSELLISLKKQDEAVESTKKAIKRFPKNLSLQYSLAKAYLASEDLENAKPVIQALQTAAPQDDRYKFAKARLLVGEENREDAYVLFDELSALEDNLLGSEARINYMMLLAAEKNYEKLVEIANITLKRKFVKPYYNTALYFKCVALDNIGYDKKNEEYEKALEYYETLEGRDNTVLIYKVVMNIALGKADKAETLVLEYEAGSGQSAESELAHYFVAVAKDETEEAKMHMVKARELNPLIEKLVVMEESA